MHDLTHIPQLPVDQIARLPRGTTLYCTVVEETRENGVVCCSRFRLSLIKRDRLFCVPVSQLDQFSIFDDGDEITLAADSIEVLVSDLGQELQQDRTWFKLRYT